MFDETGGIVGCAGMALLALVLVGLLALSCSAGLTALQDSAADGNRAQAALERAQADRERILEGAKTERERIIQEAKVEVERTLAEAKVETERVRGENWQTRFMLWTAYLEANDDDAPLIAGAILAAVLVFAGLVGGYTLAGKMRTG